MKHIIIILLSMFISPYIVSAQNSPYVETLTGNINNTGFKSTLLRSTPVSRPTPVHTALAAINTTISPRFAVAKVDASGSSKWSEASGWTNASNNSSTSAIVASPATGCNAYFELGAPAGTWRLPTQREIMIVYLMQKDMLLYLPGFTTLNTSGYYWTSTSHSSASNAWAFNPNFGFLSNFSKSSEYRVRCIRDL